ncbi:MAG: acyl-[acyl-carrier-protein]--UDP-N-acetylglucosamine O-acyltransferase [Flavobacteriales bacterium CG_4_10_14_0_2_um_filter_32_8]|nr:MAG: acyl-[acyl-carrier-protein]--UDP-N-acetylglucosamine O-acyltransferase [Flavobacteriales bacterium CG_4_10_14_0_2_um_filter_32_8]PJB15040.1 MAG: acyl-[acyl-carrier-protein]--UDP-N-acetylglucosamine O-acyltransferase [Flavobacteriales bacterium CG_4_9_14_3_um_filter_32_8]
MEKFPFTNIHPKAIIGKDVIIESFTTIHANVEIGEGTWIGSNVTIFGGARIGKNCKIFPGSVISAIPQDLKFDEEDTTAEIGDNCIIRECVTINRGTVDKHKTVVGNNCLLMAYVHIAHDCIVGNNCVLANCVNLAGHVELGNFVIIEGVAGVQQFIKIGDHSFIASGSNVRKNVPPYIKAARDPLSFAGVNSVGLRRRGFSADIIMQIEDMYRSIYVRGLNVTNAVQIIEQEAPKSEEKNIILKFIEESTKGIIRGPLN